MSDSQSPKRRRGGQPGNQNAVKHGYYSRTANRAHLIDSKIAEIVTSLMKFKPSPSPNKKAARIRYTLPPRQKSCSGDMVGSSKYLKPFLSIPRCPS